MDMVGIDTVTLVTSDFTFDMAKNMQSELPFLVGNFPKPLGMENEKSVLLADVHGVEITGDFLRPQKAIRDTGVLQIQKLGKDNLPTMKIQISIPKFLTGENYLLAEKNDLKKIYSELNDELATMGIKTDVSKAKVSRQDVTKNIIADYSPNMYIPIFRQLSASRMRDVEHNAETYTKMNGTREICFYDKRQEMLDAGESVKHLPNNVLRNEYRIKKTESVIKIYGVETFKDVYRDFDDIKEIYKNELKKGMFKSPFLDTKKTDDTMQIFWNAMQNSGKGKANFYEQGLLQILCNQTKSVIENISTEKVLDLYCDFLLSKGYDKKSISVMKCNQKIKIRKINEKMFSCMKLSPSITMQDLYNELYIKLVA